MEQRPCTSQLPGATKQWLKQHLHSICLQRGTFQLPDREVARRAALHVEEARRWLYGEYLPRAASRERFERLLAAIGASAEERAQIFRRIGLEPTQARSTGLAAEPLPAALRTEDRLIFNLESPKTGRWEIAEWTGFQSYQSILEDVRRRVRRPALSIDGRLLITVHERPSGDRHLEIVDGGGRRKAGRHCLPLLHASEGSWAPDGRAVCCQVSNDLTFRFHAIVRYDAESERSRWLTSGEFDDKRPEWSPDGAYIVFQRRGELWAVDAEGRKTWRVLDRQQGGGRPLSAPAFGPFGRRLAFVRTHNRYCAEICCLDLRANTAATLMTNPDVAYRDPCWSPDGEHLLVASNRATGHNLELWLFDADGGNPKQLTAYGGNIRRPIWQARRPIEHTPRLLRLV